MMVLYGAGMSDSNRHDNKGLPLVLVGGGAGRLNAGGHLRYQERTSISNLHLTVLDKMGVHVDKMSDATGRLELLPVG